MAHARVAMLCKEKNALICLGRNLVFRSKTADRTESFFRRSHRALSLCKATKPPTTGQSHAQNRLDHDRRTEYHYDVGDAYVPGLWRSVSGVAEYLHNDHLGTLRRTSTIAGLPGADSDVYTAFGERVTTGPIDRYGYVGAFGYQQHTEFPFLHVGARWYDPGSGRFLQRDPLGILAAVNVYEYVGGSPTVATDPSGLISSIHGAVLTGALSAKEVAELLGLTVIAVVVAHEVTDLIIATTHCGPSGHPKVHNVKHSTRKRAKDAARDQGDGAPMHHPSPKKGEPHFHPVDRQGNKIPGRPHHEYPG